MKINQIKDPSEKRQICEKTLRSLPDWFAIESAIVDYINDIQSLETWAAFQEETVCGFISIKKHTEYAAEIYVMGIRPEYHGKGIGSELIRKIQESLASRGFKFLTVKTLSQSRPDTFYDKTRNFYLRTGFTPIEEFKTLWGEHNPCLMLIKTLNN